MEEDGDDGGGGQDGDDDDGCVEEEDDGDDGDDYACAEDDGVKSYLMVGCDPLCNPSQLRHPCNAALQQAEVQKSTL